MWACEAYPGEVAGSVVITHDAALESKVGKSICGNQQVVGLTPAAITDPTCSLFTAAHSHVIRSGFHDWHVDGDDPHPLFDVGLTPAAAADRYVGQMWVMLEKNSSEVPT